MSVMTAATTSTLPFADESRACRAAQKRWAALPLRERLRPIAQLRQLLVEESDRLCEAVERDVNRPAAEVLSTDIVPTADALKYLQKDAEQVLRAQSVSIFRRPLWLWGQRDVIHRRPHGVVGIIGTWNYPIFLNAVQIAQALTAGNGVLWKPSELMPDSAERLHALFLRAGYPPDLVQRLPATREAGPMVAEAAVDHVVFTGSAPVGRKLAARLGERLISSTLELSGVDAMFVLADANVAMAAKAAWFGLTLNKGQTCLAVRRIFVERPVCAAFLDALRPLAAQAKPMELALESQVRQAERMVADAQSLGAHVLHTGEPPTSRLEMPPTIVTDATPEMLICRDAAFAPVSAVIPFDTIDEALAMNARCEYGLGASIFTADIAKANQLAARLSVGMVSINDVIAPTGHPATPFGGRGASGWGVTQGAEGLLAMTVPQVVSVRGGTFRPHYKPIDSSSPLVPVMRGLLEWCHAKGAARWRGLKRILANGWKALK
jgi:acyl-CoA reductase-like NAD-dependent aldehyde dehydrogenase